ncbi:DUF2797 domain-containing protein [Haloglomus litoreum]|uniref:DUF2797 domain-containing protein n=1 Tax=Haloglomus litoreum TaxID=3034026 RepID=UPI0023E8B0B1|nr:DUF2797 domain-containing protein [Haloglomus sp. DT116]
MQIVGYDRSPDPALLLGDEGAVERVPLTPGTTLDYGLEERHCAGAVVAADATDGPDGEAGLRHRACGASRAPYCRDHTSTWACARCTGNCDMPLENCHREHVLYLAAFAPDVFKVGVTKPDRLETRLREQGADRAALLEHHPDGRVARQREAGLAERLPDRVRTPTKVAGLARPVDTEAWAALLAEFDPLETFEFDYGLDLDGRPVRETLATGTVRGVQGRLLVLENAGSSYAVDLRDLVGHEVGDGAGERDIQSSLGKFG